MLGRSQGFVAPIPASSRKERVNLNTSSLVRKNVPIYPRRRANNGTSWRRHLVPSARVRRGKKPTPVIPDSLYDAGPQRDIDYELFDFNTLKDKVVLVVNVASSDQFTESNYKLFVDLLEKYHAGGFEIVVYPSNWYGQYETGSPEEIKNFVHKYSDKIKVMAKCDLEWNPVFALGRKYFPGQIVWNFHGKFLFGRKGLPVSRFDLVTTQETIESEVSLYVNNTDAKLHTSVVPNPIDDDEDEDMMYMSEEIKQKAKQLAEEEGSALSNLGVIEEEEIDEPDIDHVSVFNDYMDPEDDLDADDDLDPETDFNADTDNETATETVADVDANAAQVEAEEEAERVQNQ